MLSVLYHIEEKIQEQFDKIAIIHDGDTFTYQQLSLRANRLCNYLSNLQVKKGDKVAFLMRRSFDMLATILAIWRMGATYVPLDLNIPEHRLNHILCEVSPRCIISEPAFLERFSSQKIAVLTFHDLSCRECEAIYKKVIDTQVSSNQLAYLIYTSGSTGQPKGVMVTHDNLLNHISWLRQEFSFTQDDCFSFNSSIAFDFSVACTLLPLSVGAKIAITSEEVILDIGEYCRQLIENKVTFVKWTPSYFSYLIDYVENHQINFSLLRYVMLAGEELIVDLVKRWLKLYPKHSLVNEYGPTEATVGVMLHRICPDTLDEKLFSVPIGQQGLNIACYVVDNCYEKVDKGEVGELLIGGASVSLGYFKQSKLTAEKFIDKPSLYQEGKLYRTGDLVRQLTNGNYLYIGRIDDQLKINGYRVEINEVKSRILKCPGVKQAAVNFDKSKHALQAFVIFKKDNLIDSKKLRDYLSSYLPAFMIPNYFIQVNTIPMNQNGKIDFLKLEKQVLSQKNDNSNIFEASPNHPVDFLVKLLKRLTGIEVISTNSTFFSLGMDSLSLIKTADFINKKYTSAVKIQDLFTYPTIRSLANFIDERLGKQVKEKVFNTKSSKAKDQLLDEDVAIIAMDCRLPGANNCEELWELCCQAKEAITFFEKKENTESQSLGDSSSVYARGILDGIENFDADFFGFTPKEAKLSDPQHRLMLESAWTVLEKAGYLVDKEDSDKIGVFVSMNDSTYQLDHNIMQLKKREELSQSVLQRLTSSQFLATKIAYYLNCTGPSLTIQTACSSSLVAVIMACQQLLARQCDIALAGGVSITTPQDKPYFSQQGNIFSPDGHCRPFDSRAEGTVFSNGMGLVVLKRLSEAICDRDVILSVIKGFAINNDGSKKMSYTSPSVKGQVDCILSAQRKAQINLNNINYIEAHGTGTLIGDPIEVEALTKAFRMRTNKRQYCALGSLKANIGHTHVAAGVAGLIKSTLALKHKKIPPMINYQQANPNIDFKNSPFYINTRIQYWERWQLPRCAAVSAFGVGGTNAHLILEEAPEISDHDMPSRDFFVFLFSAKSVESLLDYYDKVIYFIENMKLEINERIFLADMAYTLQCGRKHFSYRSAIVCRDMRGALLELRKSKDVIVRDSVLKSDRKLPIIFLFPGHDAQSHNLALHLYQQEPVYKNYIDQCFEYASKYINRNLKNILFPNLSVGLLEKAELYQAEFIHPILFSVEYALAKLLMYWGVEPDATLGHGLGEYVAACLAGVFSLEDAIKLVCFRGKVIATCDKDSMLVVPVLEKPAEPFRKALASVVKKSPTIPFLSNLTGDWAEEADVTSDQYWINHMISTVQFSDCVNHLDSYKDSIFLEVGPGSTLLTLLQKSMQGKIKSIQLIPSVNTIGKSYIELALKKLWMYGHSIHWHNYYSAERRGKILLPTYCFQRKHYWLDEYLLPHKQNISLGKNDVRIFTPTWKRDVNLENFCYFSNKGVMKCRWVVFDDGSNLSKKIISDLDKKYNIIIVKESNQFGSQKSKIFTINPRNNEHYRKLFKQIGIKNNEHCLILHFWCAKKIDFQFRENLLDDSALYYGLYSGIFVAQAFYHESPQATVSCLMVSTQLHSVLGDEEINPLKSTLLSLCRVLSLENKNFNFGNIDIPVNLGQKEISLYSRKIIGNMESYAFIDEGKLNNIIAIRGQYCWVPMYQAVKNHEKSKTNLVINKNAIYFISGGLGGMGLTIADWLSRKMPTTLLLLSRNAFPKESEWDGWLTQHGSENSVSKSILKIKNIINRGSAVIIKSADISNYKQMQVILSECQEIEKPIKGIFHCAGIPGEGIVASKQMNTIRSVLLAKIQGTSVLSRLFNDTALDFVVFASSLTAVVGGIGQIDYCAANLFLDHFNATKFFGKCKKHLSINWNAWSTIGMAESIVGSEIHSKLYSDNQIKPDQAMQMLEYLLSNYSDQIIVSRFSPSDEINRIKDHFALNQHSSCIKIRKPDFAGSIKEIIQKILGVDSINSNDNIYSLGADSLTAIQLLEIVEKKFNVALKLADLMRADTPAKIEQLLDSCSINSDNIIIPLGNTDITLPQQFEKSIYFIHPAGGTIFCYFSLYSHLKMQFPAYAIQDYELALEKDLFNSIQEMAQFYANEIIRLNQSGKVVLVGYSFGGNLAVEMVSFLQNKGLIVEKIILIDSWANLKKLSANCNPKLLSEENELGSLKFIKQYYGLSSPRYLIVNKHLKWLHEYVPTLTNVKIILLKARNLSPFYNRMADPDNGWSLSCYHLFARYLIAGDHDTVLRSDHLPKVCELLDSLI